MSLKPDNHQYNDNEVLAMSNHNMIHIVQDGEQRPKTAGNP